jgi:hypothetical protein
MGRVIKLSYVMSHDCDHESCGSTLNVANDQNRPKNDVKNEVKNGYCECSEMQTSGK